MTQSSQEIKWIPLCLDEMKLAKFKVDFKQDYFRLCRNIDRWKRNAAKTTQNFEKWDEVSLTPTFWVDAILKLEAVLGQLRCEVLPPLSIVAALEQNGIAKNVSLATVFLHSNQATFHVKPHSAPETEQNKPNFKSLSGFGVKWQPKECFPSNGIFA